MGCLLPSFAVPGVGSTGAAFLSEVSLHFLFKIALIAHAQYQPLANDTLPHRDRGIVRVVRDQNAVSLFLYPLPPIQKTPICPGLISFVTLCLPESLP